MIPLLPAAEFEANPAFGEIWEHVTTRLLEHDGSRRTANEERIKAWSDGTAKETAAVDHGEVLKGKEEESFSNRQTLKSSDANDDKKMPRDFENELRTIRIARMKRHILSEILSEVAYREDLSRDLVTKPGASSKSRLPLPKDAGVQDVTNMATDMHYDDGLGVAKKAIAETRSRMNPATQQSGRLTHLRDLILTIASYLDMSLDPSSVRVLSTDEEDLLSENIADFRANILLIGDEVSVRLNELEASLARLSTLANNQVGATDNASYSSSLDESIRTQIDHLKDLHTNTLPASLSTLTITLQNLLALQRRLLQLQLQHLETSKRGVLSRYNASKIAFLDIVAETMALKTQVLVLEARIEIESSPDAERRKESTKRSMRELEAEDAVVEERVALLEGVLAEYDALDPGGRGGQGVGGEVMRKLGKRYKEIDMEMETVKKDIEALERRRKT